MNITVREMLDKDIDCCARIACTSLLQDVYGFTTQGWKERLSSALPISENLLFVAEREEVVMGFAWAHPRGAFLAAPYLRFIAVDEKSRGLGIGALLLDEYEKRTAHTGKDYFLLVSDFNASAIRFYTEHGYHQVGKLPDFVVSGVAEIIMVKELAK